MGMLIILFQAILCICHLISVADCTDSTSRVTIASPGWKTANPGDYGKLQWIVISGSFSNYTISKTGSAVIDSNTYQTYDIVKGVITLHFWNIQTSNGGYYSLSVTPDPLLQTFVGSLFVYSITYTNPILNGGSMSPSFGSTIEVNCTTSTSSLPPEKRQKLYYYWTHGAYGDFQNVSIGAVILRNGDPLPGYSIKNDGKTLVVASVQINDTRGIGCKAKEWGSPDFRIDYVMLYLTTQYPPYISLPYLGRNRVNVDLSSSKSLYWNAYYVANPVITTYSNWNFVNRTGFKRVFPLNNGTLTNGYVSLSTSLPNKEYYGNYSMTIGNTLGSINITFQVLEQGAPDMPTNLTVLYTTHSVIGLKWKCQPGNSGLDQTVLLRLRDVANNADIETRRIYVSDSCVNTVYQTIFQNAIQPESMYQATIWSTNPFGNSGNSSINFKTQPRVFLTVTPETISIVVKSIIQLDALINVTSTYPDMAWLNVSCCVEETNECLVKSYNVFYSMNQIVFDDLPDRTEYVFEFTLFSGDFFNYVYILALVEGVRIPGINAQRKCNTSNDQCNNSFTNRPSDAENPYFVAVIVLAVLLGIAVLALIGCLVAYLVNRRRSRKHPINVDQSATVVRSVHPTSHDTPVDDPYAKYESMYDIGEHDRSYTGLQEPPPKPPKVHTT